MRKRERMCVYVCERTRKRRPSLPTRALRTTYAGKHLQCSFGAGGIKEINYPATHTSPAPDLHIRSTQPSPFSALSPARRQRRVLTPSLQASIFSGVPPPASHIFILYCPHTLYVRSQPRDGILYQAAFLRQRNGTFVYRPNALSN